MNRYRKGAQAERDAVNEHIKKGAVFAGRLAGSKCKGKLKVDVIAIYQSNGASFHVLMLEQYKKGKQATKKEKQKFLNTKFPDFVHIKRNFIQIK